jgi:hypothetical protein
MTTPLIRRCSYKKFKQISTLITHLKESRINTINDLFPLICTSRVATTPDQIGVAYILFNRTYPNSRGDLVITGPSGRQVKPTSLTAYRDIYAHPLKLPGYSVFHEP